TAYAMIERRMAGRVWVCGDDFTIADCAAAPGLFFASIVHPFAVDRENVAAYLQRLLDRPSMKRILAEARPFFSLFPYRDAMPPQYLEA
ncbi:MAG: glutathione S-transferase family protein, partial [Aquamicrobium sp.]|nr:glutathione S-transferase family protein [Aquamicrobium sp.]